MLNRLYIVIFCLVLGTPAVVQLVSDAASGRVPAVFGVVRSVAPENLRAVEERVENDWPGTGSIRAAFQGVLLGLFREGNEKVFVAPEGWLVYRPGLSALLGAGPLGTDLVAVSRPRPAHAWFSPASAIVDFAEQLRARGVRLILVPVPDKTTAPAGGVGGVANGRPVRHPDAGAFYKNLQDAGVAVVDLATLFAAAERPVFLRTDTHWNREGLGIAVDATLRALGRSGSLPPSAEGDARAGHGDLAAMLPSGTASFSPEIAGRWPQISDPISARAQVLVLGDSFVNIYSDASLGFGSGGGFADLLGSALGTKVDRIAINGGGATSVREELARRPQLLNGIDTVVWVIAEREFSPGDPDERTSSRVWRTVDLGSAPAREPGNGAPPVEGTREIRVKAQVETVSAFPDPGEAPYRDCVGVVMYRVENVLEGTFADPTIPVVHWMFREEKLLPPSGMKPGDMHELQLEPFEDQPAEIQNIQRVDDTGDLRALWWAKSWKTVE